MKTILVDAIHTLVIKGDGIDKTLHSILEQSPHQKIVLTNAEKERFEELGLAHLPYPVFTLERNPAKTNPSFYEQCLQQYGLAVDDVVYVEHNEDAVTSARSLGIETLHFDSNKRDYVAVTQFLQKHL